METKQNNINNQVYDNMLYFSAYYINVLLLDAI